MTTEPRLGRRLSAARESFSDRDEVDELPMAREAWAALWQGVVIIGPAAMHRQSRA